MKNCSHILIRCYGALALCSIRVSPFTLWNHYNGLSLPNSPETLHVQIVNRFYHQSSTYLTMGKPKSGSIVSTYQTVSVNCDKCRTRLFRYKKKNGTKSNLVKCYIERISEDCQGLIKKRHEKEEQVGGELECNDWTCPNCETNFGRDAMIHGRPVIKLVGGKVQMTKK